MRREWIIKKYLIRVFGRMVHALRSKGRSGKRWLHNVQEQDDLRKMVIWSWILRGTVAYRGGRQGSR